MNARSPKHIVMVLPGCSVQGCVVPFENSSCSVAYNRPSTRRYTSPTPYICLTPLNRLDPRELHLYVAAVQINHPNERQMIWIG